jgi:hypothetical protein
MTMPTPILIVEGDADARKALALALERKGFRVVCAATAEEARARLPVAGAGRRKRGWSSTAVVLLVEREEPSVTAHPTPTTRRKRARLVGVASHPEPGALPPLPPSARRGARSRQRVFTAAQRAQWRWNAYAASQAARAASLRAQSQLRRTRAQLRYSGWVARPVPSVPGAGTQALTGADETRVSGVARPVLPRLTS